MMGINQDSIQEAFRESCLVFLGIYKERLTSDEDIHRYEKWLSLSYNADMKYLERNICVRKDPSYILKDVKSSICFMFPYGKILSCFNLDKVAVSKYALINDYHSIIKKEGSVIIEKLTKLYPEAKFRVITDSVPIFEKLRASSTDTGCLGLNSLYINYKYGSFVFLGEILTTLDLIEQNSIDNDDKPTNPKQRYSYCSRCGSCKKHCPSGAIKEEGIDARKCMSYLSIEHPGTIDENLWPYFIDSFFGCDRCQNFCPYNIKNIKNDTCMDIKMERDIEFDSQIRKRYKDLIVDETIINYLKNPWNLILLGETEFKKIFSSTSFLRAGFIRLTRNILIHLAGTHYKDFYSLINKVDPRVWDILDKQKLLDYFNFKSSFSSSSNKE